MKHKAADAATYRRVLGVFLVLLILDGAIRKWWLPGFEQIVFIAKDALLFGAVIHYGIYGSRRTNYLVWAPARGMLALYAAWVAIEACNPELPNLAVGIWGLKAHILYAGLIVLVPAAFSSLDDVFRQAIRIYPWIVIPVCMVAFLQLASPADSFINQQLKGGTEGTAYFGDENLVRVTGTFSYIAGMAAFVQVVVLLGIALFVAGARSRAFFTGLGFALATLPATGSRAVIVVAIIGTCIIILSAFMARLMSAVWVLRVFAALILLAFISFTTQDRTWEALAQRAEDASRDEYRAITAFTNAFAYVDDAGFGGFGSGAANLAAPALAREVAPFSWLPMGDSFEEESGRIVIELGMVGWALSITMRVALLFWALYLARRGDTRNIRTAAVLALPIVALGVWQGNGMFGGTFGPVYFWFCASLLGMAEFEQRQSQVASAHKAVERRRSAGRMSVT